MLFLFLASFLVACGDPDASGCDIDGPHLLLTTTDFEVGALAVVDPTTGCVDDAVASASADSIVRVVGGDVFVADRSFGDAIRRYAPGRYGRPEAEFVVDRGGNVHDVVGVDGALWFSLYERDALVKTTRAGAELERVDLSPWADADGLPEADRLIATEAGLFVGLQRFVRGEVWSPEAGGVLQIAVDGASAPVGLTSTGPNPKIAPYPDEPGRLLAATGVYGEADGALVVVDPAAGGAAAGGGEEAGSEVVIDEVALGFDLERVVGIGSRVVATGTGFDLDDPGVIVCVDLATGAVETGAVEGAWFVDAVAGDGSVYVAVRSSFGGEAADAVWAVDPATCEIDRLATAFALDPYSIGWVAP